jgi:hypothetical protein
MAEKHDNISNINDPNKSRITHFLDSTGEKLSKIEWDYRTLKERDKIVAAYKFGSHDQSLTITLISATSYHDANRIAEVNAFNEVPHSRWGVNGGILYLAQSGDEDKVSDIVSLFAGKE